MVITSPVVVVPERWYTSLESWDEYDQLRRQQVGGRRGNLFPFSGPVVASSDPCFAQDVVPVVSGPNSCRVSLTRSPGNPPSSPDAETPVSGPEFDFDKRW